MKCEKNKFHEGQIISFRHPSTGVEYDGVVWRVLLEDETNVSLVLRYVDSIDFEVSK